MDTRFEPGDHVAIGDFIDGVPDDADERVALWPSVVPATVIEDQEDATLILLGGGDGRIFAVMGEDRKRLTPFVRNAIPLPSIDANERRVILAALETYQSMWAAAVLEARKDGEPIDERLAQGRYDEAGELLAKFQREVEGASAAEMIGKLDVNIAAEQARDLDYATFVANRGHRQRLAREMAEQPRGTSASMAAANAFIDSVDPGIRRRGSGGEDAPERESKSAPYGAAELERLDHNLSDLR